MRSTLRAGALRSLAVLAIVASVTLSAQDSAQDSRNDAVNENVVARIKTEG
jgi:hypothetical protein